MEVLALWTFSHYLKIGVIHFMCVTDWDSVKSLGKLAKMLSKTAANSRALKGARKRTINNRLTTSCHIKHIRRCISIAKEAAVALNVD